MRSSSRSNGRIAIKGSLAAIVRCLAALGLAVGSWSLAGHAVSDLQSSSSSGNLNLVLVSVDTLRADRLSVYGYSRRTTPVLESLARDGVMFEEFYYNGGGTLPSHMSLFTSHHPAAHGIEPTSDRALSPRIRVLTEILQEAGYATAAFVDPGWLNPRYGFGRGFSLYDDAGHRLRATLPRALAWIRQYSDRRFFLFLHTYDVHSTGLGEKLPYDCPGEVEWTFVADRPRGYDGCRGDLCGTKLLRHLNATAADQDTLVSDLLPPEQLSVISDLYDGCINYVDQQLGVLTEQLRRDGLLDRTLVVVLSDHGEEFGEHGRLLHDQGGFEELARIPWIMRVPGLRNRGQRVRGLAAMVDVAPTILDMLNLPPLPEAQGRSLRSSIKSGQTGRREVHMYSVLRGGSMKAFPDEGLLFDLDQDSLEQTNLWGIRPQLRDRMIVRSLRLAEIDLARLRDVTSEKSTKGEVVLTDEDLARLRALGYLR